ncbi:hypothetical protein M107_3943 [Bacteroides fragilis str. 3725 D9(v)]|nr:hypothetical protein M107_3943 [Bacteroides fragilis str. 3725 D9(v)]EXZ87874.1 hypothetical protein M068_3627 [Bacteroides fragilis str. J38-1]
MQIVTAKSKRAVSLLETEFDTALSLTFWGYSSFKLKVYLC